MGLPEIPKLPFPASKIAYHNDPKHHERHKEQTRKNKEYNWPERCGFIWSEFEENQLRIAYERGTSIAQLCKRHKRGPNGINSRLKMLDLL